MNEYEITFIAIEEKIKRLHNDVQFNLVVILLCAAVGLVVIFLLASIPSVNTHTIKINTIFNGLGGLCLSAVGFIGVKTYNLKSHISAGSMLHVLYKEAVGPPKKPDYDSVHGAVWNWIKESCK